MALHYSVDLEGLEAVIKEMTAFEAAMENQLHELDAVMTQLHQVWTGAASQAQEHAHREWVDGATEMRNALKRLRSAAEIGHGNYAAAGRANAVMWSRVR